MGAEDAILVNQIRNARLPLVRPPAGHGHHEESNRGEIHDAGVYISDSSLVSEGRLRIGTLRGALILATLSERRRLRRVGS